MTNFIDLSGRRFGRLTVLRRTKLQCGKIFWECRCDCSSVTEVSGSNLRTGHIASCGCIRRKHGLSGTPTHSSWCNMMDRCYCETHHAFEDYGGRGITVCERWRESFLNFLADMGERPDGRTLGRKENDEGYSKENCNWETAKQQGRNTRTTKLTEEKAAEIRAIGRSVSQDVLADHYGVSLTAISHVLSGTTWA
jgi:hypothetical protein